MSSGCPRRPESRTGCRPRRSGNIAAGPGTTTHYSCGDEITEKDANFGGKVGKTTEVGAYPANPWGLHDMHGNVWEWVEDVWHENYEGAPDDGSAWTEGGDQGGRVMRGGSWSNASGPLSFGGPQQGPRRESGTGISVFGLPGPFSPTARYRSMARGSRASRRPSPRKLKEITVTRIRRPG